LDAQQHQVPAGVNGELYLGGVGLAAGYWQDEEQTSRRFVQVPIMGQLQRLYCTGDRVREMEDGRLQYVGRQDGQVKLRGYRIELGEIEERLRRLPQVRQAAVQLWLREQERGSLLVGYIVPWKKPGPSQSELLRGLSEQLPEYMLPAQITMEERLPLTVNGKLDRQRLPLPETHTKREAEVSEGRQETLTPIEEVLASVWEEVLGLRSIDRTDNFFRLGGHSLLGTRLIARLRAVFGVEVHITWLFESPTIAQLAPRLEVLLREGGKAAPPLVPVPRTGPLLLSYAQQRLWFVYQLDPQSTAYTVPGAARLQGDLKVSALQESFFLLQQRHESLRTSFPEQQEQPVQQIAPAPLTGLPLLDLSACPAARREEELQRLVEQETQRPFDLAAGPLCRACLLKLAEQDYVLLLS